MKLILQANRATGESANWTEEKVAIVKIFNFAEFRLENLCPGGRNGSCFPSSTVFSAVSKRLKGNSISRNFIFNLVYARCQYSNCENFLFAMSAREAMGRSRSTSFLPRHKFVRNDHSQIFVTQWELMSKNIFSDSPTQTFFTLHIFSFLLRHREEISVRSFRGSELRHLNMWWWRNARFKVLAVVVKSSGKFLASPRITFHSRNLVHECLLVQAKF